jgi:hypothetical protein
VNVPSGQSSIVPVKPVMLNAKYAQFSQTGAFPLVFNYPASWRLFKLDQSSASAAPAMLYVRLLSPDAAVDGQSHNSEFTLSSGAMIEATAFTNAQFSDVDQYLAQLGDTTLNIKKITVDGVPAVEYQIASEDLDGTPPKTVTTFFNGKTQYAVSFTVHAPSDYAKNVSTYHQIVSNISVK